VPARRTLYFHDFTQAGGAARRKGKYSLKRERSIQFYSGGKVTGKKSGAEDEEKKKKKTDHLSRNLGGPGRDPTSS